jgi:hypothetical protein
MKRERLHLSPGRCTNRENFRRCQRTILFLLLLFLESMKNEDPYLLFSQSSAAHSQAGELDLVQAFRWRAAGWTTAAMGGGISLPAGMGKTGTMVSRL